MKKSTKKGFTLVELVIVIAVIAILAAVLIPTFSNVVARANASADLQTLTTNLEGKFVEYVADAHKAPTGILVKYDSTKNTTTFVDFVAADYDIAESGEYTPVSDYDVLSKAYLTGTNGYAFVVGLTNDGSYTVAHVTSAGSQPEPMLYTEFVKDARFVDAEAKVDAVKAAIATTVKTESDKSSEVTKLAKQNFYGNGDVVAAEYTRTVEGDSSESTDDVTTKYVKGTFTLTVTGGDTITATVKTEAVAD